MYNAGADKDAFEKLSSASEQEMADRESESSDTHGLRELESWQKSAQSNYSFSNTDKIVNIPISITSYLSGRRRMAIGSSPKVSNRMLCALASDHLSGAPFRAFLKKQGNDLDMRYLSFWSDVRHYLDSEDGNTDCFGTPLKQSLAKTITKRYLSSNCSDAEIFSEGLKMTLFTCLRRNDDVSLLCSAQDIVTGVRLTFVISGLVFWRVHWIDRQGFIGLHVHNTFYSFWLCHIYIMSF